MLARERLANPNCERKKKRKEKITYQTRRGMSVNPEGNQQEGKRGGVSEGDGEG
ncbi:hypothetical protein BDV30DRAFT_221279 [Aspergillus minisclerotigenes]|uniref:Uncharacterized protein n=1 Tax=Aspergillus minisclerotigenes TaxID=656917 RepID=A0A5N6IJ97_9EURO|nr:hypothetical protein BDV30DRAFT_221279 [Aspergillus minisclerotigenes]